MGPGWRDFVATNRTVTFSGLVAALEGITIGECHRALCTHVHTRELTRITNDTGMSELLSLSLSLSLSSVTQIRLQHWFSPSLASPMYISRYASLHLPPPKKNQHSLFSECPRTSPSGPSVPNAPLHDSVGSVASSSAISFFLLSLTHTTSPSEAQAQVNLHYSLQVLALFYSPKSAFGLIGKLGRRVF